MQKYILIVIIAFLLSSCGESKELEEQVHTATASGNLETLSEPITEEEIATYNSLEKEYEVERQNQEKQEEKEILEKTEEINSIQGVEDRKLVEQWEADKKTKEQLLLDPNKDAEAERKNEEFLQQFKK